MKDVIERAERALKFAEAKGDSGMVSLMASDLRALLCVEIPRHWVFAATEALRDAVDALPDYGDTKTVTRSHLLSMLDEVKRTTMSATKACRWLGWIQASLVAHGVTTLEAMKAHNKQFSGAKP